MKIVLYDPVITLLVIYPKECKSGHNRDICTPMLVAALFTIAKPWKEPRYPKTDEWTKKCGLRIYSGILFNHKEERNVLCR
jgi:hypothetical protein